MLAALDVAKHLIRVGYDPENPLESVCICPLRLQKLLYYCQGWSLALLGRKLFDEPLQAWIEGPVVRSVYDQFSGSRSPLLPEAFEGPQVSLSMTEAALVEMVWKEYSRFTPKELVVKTHNEPAWSEAREGLPPTERSTSRLSEETMMDSFKKLASSKSCIQPGFPPIDPAKAWKAEEASEKSGSTGIPAKDLFHSLLSQ